MINVSQVQECLKNRVGFRQPDNPETSRIYDDLTVSESGNYFQGVHPLINLENLHSIAPQFDKYVHDPYNVATTYKIGNRVGVSGKVYESIANENLGNAVTDATKWEEIDLFSEWLQNIKLEAITKVINKALTEKKLRGELKSVFENLNLFEGSGRASDTIIKEGRFVFWEFQLKNQNNLNIILQSIGTQLTQANATPLKIYVYHSSQHEPIFTQDLTLAKPYSFLRSSLTNALLNYQGGSYYVGYYEDDLTGQAIKKYDYIFDQALCSTCNAHNYMAFSKWSKYVTVRPGYVSSSNIDSDRNLFDVSKVVHTPNNNYGMNFYLTVQCDLSSFVCGNKAVFDNAIALQVGVDVLQEIGNSVRVNGITEQTRKLALFALDNRDNYTPGLTQQLDKAIKALDFDMSGLGECLPCKESRGIRTVAI